MAPALLIALRFIQGFFAGGEWGSGAVITMETAPSRSRGILSGFLQSGYNFGFVIASIVFQFTVFAFPGEQFNEIGWRMMFFTGLVPGFVALFVRYKMTESEKWVSKQSKITRSPIRNVFLQKQPRRYFFLALIIMTGLMYSYYSAMGFYPTFLQNYVHLQKHEVAGLMVVATTTSLFGQIFTGFLSQVIGRLKTIAIIAISAIIFSIPALLMIYNSTTIFERALFTVVYIFVATTGFGPIPALLAERFSTEIRNSAAGFVYNAGLIAGSWAPVVAVTMLANAGNMVPFLLGLNIVIGSAVIIIGCKLNEETSGVELD